MASPIRQLGLGFSWLHPQLPPPPSACSCLCGLGRSREEKVNETFPDSRPDQARGKKGGFRLGCVPAGKVDLSCVTRPPGATASPRGHLWCHRGRAGGHRAGSPSKSTVGGDEAIAMTCPSGLPGLLPSAGKSRRPRGGAEGGAQVSPAGRPLQGCWHGRVRSSLGKVQEENNKCKSHEVGPSAPLKETASKAGF